VADLTERDVIARVPTLADEKLTVLNRREPISVPPGTSLGDCIAEIRKVGVGDSVLVCDERNRLVGVLTERDIFAQLIGTGVDLGRSVETYLTTDPRTLRPDQTVRDALELMQTGRYRNVPIVDETGTLIGVVRQVDILRYLAESFPQELLNLPPRPHQLMETSEGG
jgi:CBS domain-containing protein